MEGGQVVSKKRRIKKLERDLASLMAACDDLVLVVIGLLRPTEVPGFMPVTQTMMEDTPAALTYHLNERIAKWQEPRA